MPSIPRLPKSLTLPIYAAGAIASNVVSKTGLPVVGAIAATTLNKAGVPPEASCALGMALTAFGSSVLTSRFSRHVDEFNKQCDKDSAAGKSPLNHDIENAAREAYRNTLHCLINDLAGTGAFSKTDDDKRWLRAMNKAFRSKEPPAGYTWPEFSVETNDAKMAVEKLWSSSAEAFAPELREKAVEWFAMLARQTKTNMPADMRDALKSGCWQTAGGAQCELSALWAEWFRREIKDSPPAATAHLFETLARLVEGQQKILSRLDAAPSGDGQQGADLRSLQNQLEAIAQKLKSSDQRMLDELAEIKESIPVAKDLVDRLLKAVDGLEDITERQENVTNQLKQSVDDLNQTIAAIDKISRAYTDLQNQLAREKFTPEEHWQRALEKVASEAGIPRQEMEERINVFVDMVRVGVRADFMDKARADFVERRFLDAAENAGNAFESAKAKVAAAKKVEEMGRKEKREGLEKLFEAGIMKGRSLLAAEKFGEAVEISSDALEEIAKEDAPERWAELQFLLGNAAANWANRLEGVFVGQRRKQAVAAYRAALEVRTRKDFPQDWAMTQNNLAVALSDQANASEGEEQVRLLGEAVAAYRAALEVYTRKDFPQDWAMTQNNLAFALDAQANASEGKEQARLLGEAVAACRAALEVYTRKDFPQYWATTQNNLADALSAQAKASEGEKQARLLDEAVAAYRASLEVRTRKDFPQYWAATQNNLAIALRDQAKASEGAERIRLYAEAIACLERALEIFAKERFPAQHQRTQRLLSRVRETLAEAEAEGRP